jgi:hypothetical protein
MISNENIHFYSGAVIQYFCCKETVKAKLSHYCHAGEKGDRKYSF